MYEEKNAEENRMLKSANEICQEDNFFSIQRLSAKEQQAPEMINIEKKHKLSSIPTTVNEIRQDKAPTNFEKIDNAKDIRLYLQDISHRLDGKFLCCQYTSIGKLEKIFASKKWKLGRPESMNDHYEYEQYSKQAWAGKYYACFMKTDIESVAMWSMYAQPWERGIRIAIPKNAFKRWIREMCEKNVAYDCLGNIVQGVNLSFSSIMYANETESQLSCGGAKNTNCYSAIKNSSMAGYVKDAAWDYEKEVRVFATLSPDMNYPALFVDVPDYVFSDMIIMTGPRFDASLRKHLEDIRYGCGTVENSKFTKKLSWVYCDDCQIKETQK